MYPACSGWWSVSYFSGRCRGNHSMESENYGFQMESISNETDQKNECTHSASLFERKKLFLVLLFRIIPPYVKNSTIAA